RAAHGRAHVRLRSPPLDQPRHLLRLRRGVRLRHLRNAPEDSPVNPFIYGISSLLDVSMLLYIGVGLVLGFMVGAVPGSTAPRAVALAACFTMTLEPVQGLAVMLTIYVAANFGDRVPSILINTPGTPASIATTLDGYPMAKQGRAGLALTISAIVSAV